MTHRMTETADAVVLAPATPASASVIWLHGLGADGHDFVPIVPELRLPAVPGIRFVFPATPERLVTVDRFPLYFAGAATAAASELRGISDRLGTLTAGKTADVIAVPGNPLDDIGQTQKVFFVMKEGVIYRNGL